ncbi:hypothetical protein F5X96DRAFT_626422 [Biscogniauxia mediterranea]|nr:hypothetical protein F5X96DRAFT_626422 [Biscogniauxia mediterranea]
MASLVFLAFCLLPPPSSLMDPFPLLETSLHRSRQASARVVGWSPSTAWWPTVLHDDLMSTAQVASAQEGEGGRQPKQRAKGRHQNISTDTVTGDPWSCAATSDLKWAVLRLAYVRWRREQMGVLRVAASEQP